jgi:hypothetical protein
MRRSRKASAALTALAALCAALVGYAASESAGDLPELPEYGEGRKLCELSNHAVTESSGVACSRRTPGVFWTHNDSGDSARIFAFDKDGADLATYTIEDARAVDWEDMASFTLDEKPILLLGDVGDNNRKRETCTLYAVVEPQVDPDKKQQTGKVKLLYTIRFRYEDGARNCESIAVDPTSRTILIVSKEAGFTSRVYELPWPEKESDEIQVARHVATVRVVASTAMDISPDGRRAVIGTYASAFEYVRRPDEKWADALARRPRRIALPQRAQGESICYGPDGTTLYLTSEKLPTPLIEVPVVESGM